MTDSTGGARGCPGVIVVFAKAPRAGLVKTRLCPPLDPAEAADLYAQMLDDVLESTARFAGGSGLEAVLAVHPADARAELAARAPRGFRVIGQRGGGLAERMAYAVAEAAAGGAEKILLRGSDNPALGRACLDAAVAALDSSELVLSPDLDGGYGLIGTRGSWPALFDHATSTRTLLEDTLATALRLGLRTTTLATSFDLDCAADLVRLLAAHRRGELDGCARTVGWILQHGHIVSG